MTVELTAAGKAAWDEWREWRSAGASRPSDPRAWNAIAQAVLDEAAGAVYVAGDGTFMAEKDAIVDRIQALGLPPEPEQVSDEWISMVLANPHVYDPEFVLLAQEVQERREADDE